ncbi:DUF4377 domain-containing protein [Alicycliphilus denitrificans]|uniref:DUF4377 domain-containing protein n=1 Tax=Alicycliphilus denitrificans TaxID=179636 RepID=UPI00384AD0C4
MNHRTTIPRLCTLALAALMTACTSTPSQPQAGAPDLAAYDWNLTAALDAQGRPDGRWLPAGHDPLQLHFEGQQLSVRKLCNLLGARFGTRGDEMQLAQPLSTKRACADPALMQLEQRVGAQLPTVQRYQLHAGGTPRLQLFFADGSRWELAGQPTPQTQYGGPGERMFLEVAPERVACSRGPVQTAQCLRVRELRYGDNGVKTHVGPWQPFYDEVQGYTHEPGVRTVLRLNRFKRQNAPADASAYAYVLDMVVESERVK